jgi:hypothetical protein
MYIKGLQGFLFNLRKTGKNSFAELEPSLKDEIYTNWQRTFNAWGYER